MPENTSSTTLYRIDECSDVMADACVGDDQGNLIFLSIWARDTADGKVKGFLVETGRPGWSASRGGW